jgi:hypothetical protein
LQDDEADLQRHSGTQRQHATAVPGFANLQFRLSISAQSWDNDRHKPEPAKVPVDTDRTLSPAQSPKAGPFKLLRLGLWSPKVLISAILIAAAGRIGYLALILLYASVTHGPPRYWLVALLLIVGACAAVAGIKIWQHSISSMVRTPRAPKSRPRTSTSLATRVPTVQRRKR